MFVGADQVRLAIVGVVILLTNGAMYLDLAFRLCMDRSFLLESTGSHLIKAIKNEKEKLEGMTSCINRKNKKSQWYVRCLS